MEQDSREKSMLYRMLQGTSKKEDSMEKEIFAADLSKADGDEAGRGTRNDGIMKIKLNYLDALKRNVMLRDMEENTTAYFADFMLDGTDPDGYQKMFLRELQQLAKSVLETRELDYREPTNAQICIKIPENLMAAWLFVLPPENGGKDITEDLIWEALNECRVYSGIKDSVIKRLVRDKEYLKLAEVAVGKWPSDGVEGKIVDRYLRIERQDVDLEEVDVHSVNWLHNVNPGDVICEVTFPIPSMPGENIMGDSLEGKPIPLLDLPIGSNVILNQEGTALVSKIKGTLFFEHGRFEVKNVVNILSDVGMNTGNIDTIGNLQINGDVTSGFSVQATGNVTIQGMVGNSTIIAGGDIHIGMGIRGNGGALLRAGGDIDCVYMENCTVKARGKVISGSIINCDVASNTEVEGKKILGGSIAAFHKISAKVVGNPQRKQTMFYLGVTQDTLQEKIVLEDQIRELEDTIRREVKSIRFLSSEKIRTEKQEEQFQQSKVDREEHEKELKECQEQLVQLDKVIQGVPQCELEASMLYPPVKIMMRSDSLMIDQEQSMFRIWTENGEIRML